MELQQGQPKRILVVDDSQAVRMVLSKALHDVGHDMLTAEDGVVALELLEQYHPDIVITDWNMPRMDGKELCGRIREQGTEQYIYIVLMTSHTDSIDLITALRAGADEFMPKPLHIGELCTRLNAASRLLDVERKLRVQASHDSLTGLLNREAFETILESEHARCLRYGRQLSLLMIDVDHFKEINDTHGHRAGDAVLCQIADLLKNNVRGSSYINRYGGDEFCVLLEETGQEGAMACAQRLQRKFAELVVRHESIEIHVRISIGLTECDLTAFTPNALVERADQALYQSKRDGRDNIRVWTPQLLESFA